MHSGDLINEETIVPGGQKPVGSSIEGHRPQKIGVPTSGIAAPATTASENIVNTEFTTIRALCASVGASNPGTYLGEWNRQTNWEVL